MSAICVPVVAFAADKKLVDLINLITTYLGYIMGLFMVFAVVVFVYYVIKYFIMPNEDRKEAGNYVMYSIIGFFVIASFWGLVNIVKNTFALDNSGGQSWSQLNSIFPR